MPISLSRTLHKITFSLGRLTPPFSPSNHRDDIHPHNASVRPNTFINFQRALNDAPPRWCHAPSSISDSCCFYPRPKITPGQEIPTPTFFFGVPFGGGRWVAVGMRSGNNGGTRGSLLGEGTKTNKLRYAYCEDRNVDSWQVGISEDLDLF